MKKFFDVVCWGVIAVALAYEPAHSQSVVNYLKANGSSQAVAAATPLPVIGTITPSGTQDVNVKQIGGVATAVNTGNSSNGTQRVVLATDQPAISFTSTAYAPVMPAAATATNSVLSGCQYNTTPPTFTDGQQGRVTCSVRGGIVVSGGVAPGSSAIYSPVSVSGNDSAAGTGAVHTLHTDASGNLNVVGNIADGGAISAASPVLVAGQDGTNVQTLFTDTSGRQRVVGAASAGSAIAGDPILMAGSDGTNARALRTDTAGNVTIANGSSVIATGNTASGATDTGNPVKIGCVNNTTLPTVTTGQRVDCQSSVRGSIEINLLDGDSTTKAIVGAPADNVTFNGALRVQAANLLYDGTNEDMQRSIPGAIVATNTGVGTTAVEETGRLFSHIAGAATTVIKSGAGFLHTFIINTKGAAATATIYDNTAGSGTVIAIVDLTGVSGTGTTYDVAFLTGLTVVTTGTLSDITVSYR